MRLQTESKQECNVGNERISCRNWQPAYLRSLMKERISRRTSASFDTYTWCMPRSLIDSRNLPFDTARSAEYCLGIFRRGAPQFRRKQHGQTQILVAAAGSPFSSARNEGAGIEKDFEGLDEKLVGDRRPDQSVVRVRTCTGVGGRWPRGSDIPDC